MPLSNDNFLPISDEHRIEDIFQSNLEEKVQIKWDLFHSFFCNEQKVGPLYIPKWLTMESPYELLRTFVFSSDSISRTLNAPIKKIWQK